MMKKTTMRKTAGLYKQRGVSFFGLLIIFAVCGMFLLLGLKVVPAYLDYFTVKKIITSMSTTDEVRSGTVAEIRRSFDKRATIDYQNAVKAEDLEVTKEGNETVVTAAWQHKIPLFPTWTLTIDFNVSTAAK
jgi:Domain of unknown function (DUF4845)